MKITITKTNDISGEEYAIRNNGQVIGYCHKHYVKKFRRLLNKKP